MDHEKSETTVFLDNEAITRSGNQADNEMFVTYFNDPYGDALITLSTCSYHAADGRFAVMAKRIDSY